MESRDTGYHLDFVSKPPDPLQCLLCHSVAKSPRQHERCGRLFCKSCLEDYHRTHNSCPHCKEKNPHYFRDSKSNREVLALLVRCDKVQAGCEWEGEIESLAGHNSVCPYVLVPCPRECEQGQVLRRDLESHLRDSCSERDYNCPHCNEPGRYRERVTSHLEHCPMVLTECPNTGCEEKMPSCKIASHVTTECEHTVLPCRYSTDGCNAEVPRRDLESHENDHGLHLQIVAQSARVKISALQKDVEKLITANTSLEGEIQQLKAANASLQKQYASTKEKSITLKLTEYRKKKKKNTNFSSSFYISTGYNMMIQVYANGYGAGKGTHISVFAYCCEGDRDHTLFWPFVGHVTVTLLNQLEDGNHYSRVIKITAGRNMRIGNNWGYVTFISHSSLDTQYLQYLKDDTLHFRVSVSTPNHRPWLD